TSWLLVMARLKDGQTVASAEQALRGVQPQIREATTPGDLRAEARGRYLATPFGVQPAAGGTSSMRGRYRHPVLAVMTVVALVLSCSARRRVRSCERSRRLRHWAWASSGIRGCRCASTFRRPARIHPSGRPCLNGAPRLFARRLGSHTPRYPR